MDLNKLLVKKNSFEFEPFSMIKLKESLSFCGVSKEESDGIVTQLKPQLYDGITSEEIHKKAFSLLKKYDAVYASRYNLKNAIFALGPTGYPFERLISALLKEKGYTTTVGVILNGKCVTHEIDVLAEKDGNVYVIECKFRLDARSASNVQVPLYINSRFLDVQEQWNANKKNATTLRQGWLVTNTRFTKDAIDYARCVGLTLLSWDYPKNDGIKTNIDSYGLYPITTLTTLTKQEKRQLIAKDIILVKELLQAPRYLIETSLDHDRLTLVFNEVNRLCRI